MTSLRPLYAVAALAFGGDLAARAADAPAVAPEEAFAAALREAGLAPSVLQAAVDAFARHGEAARNAEWAVAIDYARHSSEPRLFLVRLSDGAVEAMHVAHGRGSDPDHDGWATAFSNIPGSKMTSLGAFVTGATYTGKHGLSLRLHGLEPTNDAALDRAIVIHGAGYVRPGEKQGRSWGCPAVETERAGPLIDRIKEGAFVYIHGAGETRLAGRSEADRS